MPNVSITSVCNRACSYCFARDTLTAYGADGAMTLETFAEVLAYLQRSGINEIRLLGGEPTLHTQFATMLDMIFAAGLRPIVFSNGLMPPQSLNRLRAIEPGRVRVMVNASALIGGEPALVEQVRQTLRLLGRRAMLGVNLHTRQPRLDRLLDAIKDLDLIPRLRLGLTLPTLSGTNHSLPVRAYRQVGRHVAGLARAAADRGVVLNLDCGFVPCMFAHESLPALDVAVFDCGRRCNPLPDILPDGRAIACYPLADLGAVAPDQTTTAAAIRRHFQEVLDPYAALGIFSECSACELFRERRCLGGCRAAALRRLVPASRPFVLGAQHGRRDPVEVEVPVAFARAIHKMSCYAEADRPSSGKENQ